MTKSKIIIGLHGGRGVGKDTVADNLAKHVGFTKIAFADKIREECCKVFNVSENLFLDPATKDAPIHALAAYRCSGQGFTDFCCSVVGLSYSELTNPRSPRWVLQHWADHQKRALGEFYYIGVVATKILASNSHVLVADVRTAREAEYLHSLKGCAGLLRVVRPDVDSASTHFTDNPIPAHYLNGTILNDGDLDLLFIRANREIKRLIQLLLPIRIVNPKPVNEANNEQTIL